MKSTQLITKQEILARLGRKEIEFPPLKFNHVKNCQPSREDNGPDAVITISWAGKEYRFGVEARSLWTPRAVAEAADSILRVTEPGNLTPMVIIPYLSEERLRELEARGISAIDLCGNGIITVPGELLIARSGEPNRFRWESKIKNVYRGVSSLVPRAFLIRGTFPSVSEVLACIRQLGGTVTLPTISKVCKRLEQDLIIERIRAKGRTTQELRLIQPEKLLDQLEKNYVPPKIVRSLRGKFAGPPQMLLKRLSDWDKHTDGKVVLSGVGSVDNYAVMAHGPVQNFYGSDLAAITGHLGAEFTETERFPNLTLMETSDGFVYFDRRKGLVASPIQSFLEFSTGDKREKETAVQVRNLILKQFSKKEGTE